MHIWANHREKLGRAGHFGLLWWFRLRAGDQRCKKKTRQDQDEFIHASVLIFMAGFVQARYNQICLACSPTGATPIVSQLQVALNGWIAHST